MNPIWEALTTIIKPVADVVDAVHTSEEEKLQAEAALFRMQGELAIKVLEYESQLLKAKENIIVAEAQGDSWIQRSWRPLVMVAFATTAMADSFGLLANPLSSEMWTLLQLGLGGYVAGRSAEKIASKVMDKR